MSLDEEPSLGGLDEDEEEQSAVDSEWIKLVSKEGDEFICSREAAMASGTIRAMLTGPAQWRENSGQGMPTIRFETIAAPILEKTIQYFYYKQRYDNTPPPLPKFEMDVESIVPVLLAANFLDT